MRKLKDIIKNNKYASKYLKRIYYFFNAGYIKLWLLIFSIFPIKKNKIMIVSYYGKGYGDNGKYIVNELLQRENLYSIYWACNEKNKYSLPNDIKYVKFNSLKYFFHLATSKVWINNTRFKYGTRKRKKQYYIQTWHSSLRLKRIEKDAENSLSKEYVMTCKSDSKMIDIITSGCDFSTNIYQNSFWYDGEIFKSGTPRCDIFFNKNQKASIKKNIFDMYNLSNKKIILYAPTFRENDNEKSVYLDCDAFSKKLSDEYILFVRFHPLSKSHIDNTQKMINVTHYPDMQELLAISDYLITDYSGCCFDMMINNKPCILYINDIESYLQKERNLYFEFDELPFPKIKEEKDLIKAINEFDEKKYKKDIAMFNETVGLFENGEGSKNICNRIDEVIRSEKI